MKSKSKKVIKMKPEYDGSNDTFISTGSTLLDLAISGGRIRGGGIPAGIFVEVFGPSGAGKTVLLCEIAGAVQRLNGDIMFHDPEARLNKVFAEVFDLDTDGMDLSTPDTITDVFQRVRKWTPPENKVNGVFADSLAALSTNMEMDSDEGDKMGMRRAKEFSEELRKTCRIIPDRNILMVCSNQVREKIGATKYEVKYTSPGGAAVGFYASLRLRFMDAKKIKQEVKIAGKTVRRIIGVETNVEVFKSSVWKPYRSAPLIIMFDYGVDDIRANLQFIKDYTKNTTYTLGDSKLSVSMDDAIAIVENDPQHIKDLKNEVIDLWEYIETKFEKDRIPKQR